MQVLQQLSCLQVHASQLLSHVLLACRSYNMLKLPNYKRAATLKEKLLYAIGSGAGFELS
jgi:hypothetical protein